MRDELADLGCTVIVSDPDVIALSVDKLATAEWSAARGLPFVRTHTLPDGEPATPLEGAVRELVAAELGVSPADRVVT